EREGPRIVCSERRMGGPTTAPGATAEVPLPAVAVRGRARTPAALRDLLASQPQLGLDQSQATELLRDLEVRGLISGAGSDGAAPTELTPAGAAVHASLAEAVTTVTRRLYADLDPDELAVAPNVLAELTQRATPLRREL